MALRIRSLRNFILLMRNKYQVSFYSTEVRTDVTDIKDDEFRVLELYPMKKLERKKFIKFSDAQTAPPREKRMPIDQDWPSVWPTAQIFRPSVVPLPVYQGYNQKNSPPGKYANAELMKIPNFLHLTPPAIKRHCAAIKKYCTEWPKGLETDEKCDKHFPLEIITSDYCHASPTIRDERSRIVTFKIQLKSLKLDYHARDKLLRLFGEERYDAKNYTVNIVADRCPLRKQNYDYLMYILAAIHHESKIFESWESEKTEADMEKFFFEGSRHEKLVLNTIASIKTATGKENLSSEELKLSKEVVDYAKAVTEIINEGESSYSIQQYKEAVARAIGVHIPIIETHGEAVTSH